MAPPSPSTGRTEGGRIELIFGPMFSGKTTELARRAGRLIRQGKNCLIVKYKGDVRYNARRLATHDTVVDWTCEARPCVALAEVANVVAGGAYCAIAIDEGQFFADVVEYCERWANEGKIVIVAALDGTFERKPFKRVLELVPLAESVVKLNAVCTSCHGDAAFTKRTVEATQVEVRARGVGFV
eukprot:jgi/Chlat1/6221/Chrsp44S09039